MQVKKNKSDTGKVQNVLVIADCISGAERAACFAVRNLLVDKSELTLLQTYHVRSYGQSMVRNVLHILQKTAKHELSELKNRIVKNTKIKPESITKKVMQGDLLSVLKHSFGRKPETLLVLGLEQDFANPDTNCKKYIHSVLKSGIRPIYIVGSGITMINKDSVTYFFREKNIQSSPFFQYLNNVLTGYGLLQSSMVTSTDSLLKFDKSTCDNRSSNNRKFNNEYPLAEKLFRSLNDGSNEVTVQTINQ